MFKFRKLELNDLSFLCEVRNECCQEYLHDSKKFSISETVDWFETTNPLFFIIEYFEEKIGYFRTSNFNKEKKSIYIGCDLHQSYRGKGLGYLSYLNFIPILFDMLNIETLNLEVLSTNQRAKNLYKKLGFQNIENLNTPFIKNNKQIVSEFWTLEKKL
jgi:RimJ/RimL family protein N-acetyltransferase